MQTTTVQVLTEKSVIKQKSIALRGGATIKSGKEITTMDIDVSTILSFWGVPGIIGGIILYILKKKADKREKERLQRDENQKALMLMMMQSNRANSVGIRALAVAMQRIPDAKCNGDMKKALDQMDEASKKEKDFLLSLGIEHIF